VYILLGQAWSEARARADREEQANSARLQDTIERDQKRDAADDAAKQQSAGDGDVENARDMFQTTSEKQVKKDNEESEEENDMRRELKSKKEGKDSSNDVGDEEAERSRKQSQKLQKINEVSLQNIDELKEKQHVQQKLKSNEEAAKREEIREQEESAAAQKKEQETRKSADWVRLQKMMADETKDGEAAREARHKKEARDIVMARARRAEDTERDSDPYSQSSLRKLAQREVKNHMDGNGKLSGTKYRMIINKAKESSGKTSSKEDAMNVLDAYRHAIENGGRVDGGTFEDVKKEERRAMHEDNQKIRAKSAE